MLRNAAVLGQVFSLIVLAAMVDEKADSRRCVRRLAQAGLLVPFDEDRRQFRHALFQEAVYDGILKGRRRDMHERAGRTIEEVHAERLAEHYEVLAMHYSNGHSRRKAVRYLMLAGEKCVSRYALDQADAYFSDAYELLLDERPEDSPGRDSRLVELAARWAPVYWYRGDFLGLESLLGAHEERAHHLVRPRERARYGLWMERRAGTGRSSALHSCGWRRRSSSPRRSTTSSRSVSRTRGWPTR